MRLAAIIPCRTILAIVAWHTPMRCDASLCETYASPSIVFVRYISVLSVNIIHTVETVDNDTIRKWARAGQNSSCSTKWL